MKTELFQVSENSIDEIKKAAEIIKGGGVVAFPTETVYGLGANAFDKNAALSVFMAKGRPADNPLIVHIAKPADAENIAYTNELYFKLAEKFMPGPLTIILPKKDNIPKEVTAGLDSVAIRCPIHPVAKKLIELAGVPIAAPSANRSGRPSPTSAKHVFDDMDGIIPLILDGGECDIGVESTVIKITDDSIVLLRPGAVTCSMLKEVCENVTVANAVKGELKEGEKPLSPGMKYKHYAPRAELYLVDDTHVDFVKFALKKQTLENCAIMCYNEEVDLLKNGKIIPVGDKLDIREQTKTLFACLRKADEMGVEKIYAHLPKDGDSTLAMYNRMIRACAYRIIVGGKNGEE